MGGERTLGRRLSSDRDLREAIREGSLRRRGEAGPADPRGTRQRTGPLPSKPATPAQQRPAGTSRIRPALPARSDVAIANVYLGDRERALRWLRHPNRTLSGIAPRRQSTPNSVHARWRTPGQDCVWRNQLGRVYRNQKSQNPHPATLASLPLSYCASDQLFTLHLQVSPVFICRNMPLLRPSNYERRRI